MQQYQRREVQDWPNLFEQQKQSGRVSLFTAAQAT